MKRTWILLLPIIAAAGLATACRPAAPAPPPSCPAVIVQTFAPLGQSAQACQVAWHESRWDPNARNASGASGWFQLMIPLHSDLIAACPFLWRSAFDGPCNAWAAVQLYLGEGGWHPAWNGAI